MAKQVVLDASTEDNKTHVGHRSRMRRKLFDLGRDVFDDYELLEMALYAVVPYRDTNPIAHRLIAHFGSLEGVFSASVEQLCTVSGVGERTARYLLTLGRVGQSAFLPYDEPARKFSGTFVRDYLSRIFQGCKESTTYMILVDNRLSVIGTELVLEGEFGNGLRSTRPVIAKALLHGATGIILAHNHPFGPDFATEGDHSLSQWLKGECAKAGLVLFEHFIVCGNSIRPILHNLPDGVVLAEEFPWDELLRLVIGGEGNA